MAEAERYSPTVRKVPEPGLRTDRCSVQLPAGFRFLVSETTGRPCEPAFTFLIAKHTVGVRRLRLACAPNTCLAVARDLADFHHYLDACAISVREVTEETLEGYLDTMVLLESPATGRPYERATLRRRRASVVSFLSYCQDTGLLRYRFPTESVTTRYGVESRFASDTYNPTAEPMDRLVRAIHPTVLQLLLEAIGDPPLRLDPHTRAVEPQECRSWLRLCVELSLQSGLRREEACRISLSAVRTAHTDGRDALSSVAISIIGKGGRKRSVPVPVWLLNALKAYASTTRANAIEGASRVTPLFKDHGQLFVHTSARRDVLGRPIHPDTLNKHFATAREKVRGMAERQGGQALVDLVDATLLRPHALRHTYALLTFIERRRLGDSNPVKFVQSVLGHRYMATTEAIYLRSSQIYELEIQESVQHLLQSKFSVLHTDQMEIDDV